MMLAFLFLNTGGSAMNDNLAHRITETNNPMRHLVDVNTLAEMLCVPVSWVYGKSRETDPGSIPKIKCGKYLRFDPEEVMEWLRNQQEVD
jgi:predicted DNA-binding transcriptional regulator AlpA